MMKLYSLVNRFMKGIDAGIQTQHAVGEMYNKNMICESRDIFNDWNTNHKTTIVLNGGSSDKMEEFLSKISVLDKFGIPYGYFREPDASYLLTSIVFILSDKHIKKLDEIEMMYNNGSLDFHLSAMKSTTPLPIIELYNLLQPIRRLPTQR